MTFLELLSIYNSF